MGIDADMIWGVVGLSVLSMLLLGPGLWSSTNRYPFLEKPLGWVKARFGRGSQPKR